MRIASLSPAATEILFALGKSEEIVCRDQFSTFPDEAKKIPVLMGHQNIDDEDVKRFKPDVVLTSTIIQAKLADHLRLAGLHVMHQDMRTLAQVFDAIEQLGILVDREETAKHLIKKMSDELATLKNKAKLLPRKPRVYIEEWHNPPMASGNWVPELVQFAGGTSFPITSGELSREVSLQEVQKFDPDVIIISWCGAGLLADKELLLKRPEWDSLRAVKEGRVKILDDSLLNRPGPRLVEGAKRLYGFFVETVFS